MGLIGQGRRKHFFRLRTWSTVAAVADDYRLYFVEHGFVTGDPVVIKADDDLTAYAKARELAQGRTVEIWRGTRRLLRFGPQRTP
jgi:hypothetical protein